MMAISFKDVLKASELIHGLVHRTPVHRCSYLDQLSRLQLFFKCENLQKTGSFKIRGALNAAKNCDKKDPILVTHSSGNHAQGVAMAAQLCGYRAHVVMPDSTIPSKQQAVLSMGAEVTNCFSSEQARKDATATLIKELGDAAYFIPAADHPHVMAGQGTIAMEFLDEVPELDAIVASVSAGGLISGICVAAKHIKPDIKVIAAEPTAADDCYQSLIAGRIIPNPAPPQTVCDALKMSVTDNPWTVIQPMLTGVVTVSDEETVAAMKLVWERMKLVIEPSAAITVAAVMKQEFKQLAGPGVKRVGVVLCGGNVDINNLPWTRVP